MTACGEAEMWGNVLRSGLLCAALALSAPMAAHAVDDPYTPVTPREPGLAGSEVGAVCRAGAPWITFSIVRTGGDAAADQEVSLVISDGSSTLDLPLGVLSDDRLQGEIPWPAADWVRGGVSAVVQVGTTQLAVPLSPPTQGLGCRDSEVAGSVTLPSAEVGEKAVPAPGSATGSAAALPATGLDAASVLVVAAAGTGVMIAGAAALVLARRRARSAASRE